MAYLAFALYAFVSSVTPGPANVAIFGRAAQSGFRAVLPFVTGVVGGFLVVLICSEALAALGVALAGPFYLGLKAVGSLYLVYLAWQLWANADAAQHADESMAKGLGAGFLVHVTSFKAWLFPLVAFTTFAPGEGVTAAVIPVVIFWLCAVVSHLLWAAGGGALHANLSPRMLRIVNRTSAVLLAGLVVYTLLA